MVYGLYVISPVTGLSCHRHPRAWARTWHQRRGVRTTRLRRPLKAPSSGAPSASTASRLASVTISSRPSVRWDGYSYSPLFISEKQKYFFVGSLIWFLTIRS